MSDESKDIKKESTQEISATSQNPDPFVVYFTDPNYGGITEHWSGRTGLIDHMDGRWSNDASFNHRISSLIVLHGECQTTNALGEDFRDAPKDSYRYYQANAGLNNQGCYPTLEKSNDDAITALRVQRDDIYRGRNVDYLVLRNESAFNEAQAITITGDQPSINFPTKMLISVGSTTGKWYLFEEENYKGAYKEYSVSGGNENSGMYFLDSAFTVKSASTTLPVPDGDIELITYTDANFRGMEMTYGYKENSKLADLPAGISSLIVKGKGRWDFGSTPHVTSDLLFSAYAGDGNHNDGYYNIDILNQYGANDRIRRCSYVDDPQCPTPKPVSETAITLFSDPGYTGTSSKYGPYDLIHDITPNTSSIIVTGGGKWYLHTTAESHQSATSAILTSTGGRLGDGHYNVDDLIEFGVADNLRSIDYVS